MRKIFSLLMVAVLSISTAFATTVYCKMTQSWWTQDGAAVGVHYWGGASAATTWPGVRMTPVSGEEGTWTYDVPADVEGLMFVRVNGSGDIADWGAKTANLTLPTDGKNLYTITSESAVWGDPGVAGEWSVYQAGGGEDSDAYAYVKVTSAPTSWAGEYLIVYEGDSVAFNSSLANNTTDYVGIGGKYSRFSVKIHNDTIDYHDTIAAKHFTIAAIEGKTTYSIKSASNLYLGRTSTSNGLDKSSTTVYENTISYNEGNFIDIVSSAGLYMRYNKSSNEQRFRFFKADTYTAQQAIQLYKKVKIETTGGEDPVTPPTPAKFYVTGNAALVGEDKEWNPAAIKAEADTLVLNLLAEQAYALKVTVDGTWSTAKGYENLTEKPAGLSTDNDGNILFSLAEAGAVKVIYTAELFKVEGNFYVEPAGNPAKFYVTGNAALVGEDKEWNPAAIKAEADTLVLNLLAEQAYALKVTVDGTWSTAKGYENLTEKPAGLSTDNDGNILFSLAEAGAVKVIYTAELFKVEGNFYVDPVQPTPNYYIIGAGDAFGNWSFVPVMQDTFLVTDLAAGDYMFRVALEKGNWDNTKGYSDLTEKTEGLSANDDNNILFTLAEAGDVAVVYNDSVFRVIGNFYVDPTPVVPTAAVTGDMTEWGEPIPFELSEDSTFATLYNDNIKKGTYAFKMIINGGWRSNGYEFHRGFPGCAGITGNTEANMTVVIDVEGAYTFKWYFANDSLAIIYPEKSEPVLANGYYMVGKFGGVDAWDPVAENLFVVNPENENEYQLAIDLAVGDEVKVVYVAEDVITTWFPAEGDNYIVDDHHNGETTMYFRPDYQGGEGWFAGCIYVVPTSTVGFENTAADTKAVKVLKNGILVIEKNNKVYNVLGIEMK